MKRIIIIVLSVIVFVTSLNPNVVAENTEKQLKEIAEEFVTVEKQYDNGNTIMVYRNLNAFVGKVREEIPDVNNIQLAQFISDYTEQEIIVETEELAELILSADNFHVASELVKGIERKDSPKGGLRSTWNSSDGYMRIITSYTYLGTDSLGGHYNIYSTATWQTMPTVKLQDVFVLGTNASIDDTFTDSGYCSQTWKCNMGSCGATSTFYRTVNEYNLSNSGLQMQYSSGIPYLRFNCVGYCKTCNSTNPTLTKYSAFLNYQVTTNGTQMIYGAYSHKTIGVTNITVGISSSGAVTFGGIGVTHTDYQARGVTLVP